MQRLIEQKLVHNFINLCSMDLELSVKALIDMTTL